MRYRVAVLFEYPSLNGGERSMLQALESIGRDEFDVTALAPAAGRLAAALRAARIQHVPFELRDMTGVRRSRDDACRQLVEAVGTNSFNLLHANSLSMGRLTGAAADRLGNPCVAHLRDIMRLSRAAVHDLNQNRRLIAVSEATRAYHVQQGLAADRTVVQYNGVDADRFRPRPRTHAVRRERQIPDNGLLLLTIGQIGLRKGLDVLAAAAPSICQQVPNVHFGVVGERHSSKAESIAFEQQLVSTFAAAGLADRFHQFGYRDDVNLLMNEADLLVHPAKQEPLGRVLLEAAAAGLPIVATDVGGTSEIVADGVSARLVPPHDPHALATAIIGLLGNASQREQFAATARARVRRDFAPHDASRQLAELWRATLPSLPQ